MKNKKKIKKRRPFLLIIFLFLSTLLTLKSFKKINVQHLSIYGSKLFSKEDIIINSSLNLPTPLIFVKTKYIESELKKNLSLENVSVIRQILPFELKIIVKTRTPTAYGEKFLNGETISGFIDKDGFFINEKYSDKENLEKFPIQVFGWKESSSKVLSKILNFQKNNKVEFVTISFSPNGFLTLEDKSLKKIFLGFNPKIIDTQLQIISDIKNQLKGNSILKKIDNIDLTDPKNPKIKVFKR